MNVWLCIRFILCKNNELQVIVEVCVIWRKTLGMNIEYLYQNSEIKFGDLIIIKSGVRLETAACAALLNFIYIRSCVLKSLYMYLSTKNS